MLSREDLAAIFPPPKAGTAGRAAWDGYVAALTSPEGAALLARFGISTLLRLCHLLGTFGAETNLALMWESGAYSAKGIVSTFGAGHHSARVTLEEASRIAALPLEQRTRVLFERVYGTGNPKKARELGNTQAGDGWRFRGLGLNQITGRAAHEAAAAQIRCSLDDLVKPLNCLHMALLEWRAKGCNAFADADDPVSIRKLINGGSLGISIARINGLAEAREAVRRAKKVITPADFEAPAEGRPVASDAPPATIAHSTEVQAAAMTGGSGGFVMFGALQAALAKATVTGQLDTQVLAWALLTDPAFMGSMITVAGAGYWIAKRWLRFSTEGR